MRYLRIFSLILVGCLFCQATLAQKAPESSDEETQYNVREFGAKGDGSTLDTPAINKAIARAHEDGGGTVVFSPGTYVSGSIHLKSHVDLHLREGATLLGAPAGTHAFDPPEENPWSEYQDFGHSHFRNSLIWGEEVEDVSITGPGIIEGRSLTSSNEVPVGDGDKAITVKRCDDVTIENITIRGGGHFAILANGCDGLDIRHITIRTQRDAINLLSSSNVTVTNSVIEALKYEDGVPAGGDDAIAFKSDYALGQTIDTENVTIRNCILSSGANGIQFGSETVGDFRDIEISNLVIRHADKAGIGITSNDGAVIEDVTVSDVIMQQTATPIYMRVTDRGRAPGERPVGKIRNIKISDVTAVDPYGYVRKRGYAATIMGQPNHPIENIELEDIRITYKGGSLDYLGLEKDPATIVPPNVNTYQPRVMGMRPAYGFYLRYVDDVTLRNVHTGFEHPDPRPAVVVHDGQDVLLEDFEADRASGRIFDVLLGNGSNAEVRSSPGIEIMEWDEFQPQPDFRVPGPPRPTPSEVARKLGTDEQPVLMSELGPEVLARLSDHFDVPVTRLSAHISEQIDTGTHNGQEVYLIAQWQDPTLIFSNKGEFLGRIEQQGSAQGE